MSAYYQNHEPPPTTSSNPHGSLHQSSFHNLTLEHSLEDLSARFIVNLPAEELESMDRVCFQIEQAHWYYEDFIRPAALNPGLLPSYGLKAFSLLMFRSCPLLHDLLPNHASIWNSFMAYKERVPVCGAIIISEYWDKVLLVKGWAKGSSWSFPRGKINKEEPEAMCAVREVLEETGFDMTNYFHPRQFQPGYVEDEGAERIPYYVELVIKEQKIRLYFVPGVKEETVFETRTRKEISKIDWFKLNDLPTWSKDKKGRTTRTKAQLEGKQAKFYMVTPFISHLKLWIDHHKPKNLPVRNTDLSPRGNLISPPHSPSHNGLYADHHHHDDATYHLPSEIELGDSTSAEADSTEDELDDFLSPQEPVSFETTQQGTDALTAFFFGSPPAPTQDTLPLSPPSRSASFEVASTPPHVAYERQSSFLQPKPQASMNQQTKLLELLSGAVPSPPPPVARRSSRHTPQQVEQPRIESRSLLHLLNDVHLSDSPKSPYESSPQHASPAYQASPLPHQQPHSILFSDSQAPPEAANFGQPLPSHLRPERNDSERKEKHNALLRALFNVATTRPAPSPEEALTPTTGGPGSVGSYAGSSNGEGWTEQDRTMVKGGMDGLTKRGEPYGPAEDDEIWPPPVMRRNQLYPLSSPKLPSPPPPPQVFEQPSSNRQYQQIQPVPLPAARLPLNGYTSPLNAQPHLEIAQPLLPAAPSKPNGGSLLSILNGAGGERAQPPPLIAPQPSSPYSHHALLDSSPTSPPAIAPSSLRSGKDPLELLKEFRARQLGQEPIPPILPLSQAEPSPSRSIHPPLPIPPHATRPAENVVSQPPSAPLPFASNLQYSQPNSLPSPHAQQYNLPSVTQPNHQQSAPQPQAYYLPFNPHQPPNSQPQFSAPPSNYPQSNQSFYSSHPHFPSAPPPPQSFPPQFSVPPQQSFNRNPNPAQFPPQPQLQPQYQQQQFPPPAVAQNGAGMGRSAGGGNAGALLGLLNGKS